ncbi:MAG: AsmA family protein, partial [Ferruginibacter sp.]
MKIFKKIVKIFLIVIVILAGLVFAAPYIFKGKIVSLVKREVNNNLTAKVDFKDVNISFFRHFPKVSIALDSLQVTGTGDFLADTLLSAKRMDATVNFMSFIRGKDMSVYTVLLESPRINAIVNKDGLANWDIVKKNDANSGEDTTA